MTAEVQGRLSDDITRCEDDACPDRHICARWLQKGGTQWQQETFRAPGAVHCGSLILDRSTP